MKCVLSLYFRIDDASVQNIFSHWKIDLAPFHRLWIATAIQPCTRLWISAYKLTSQIFRDLEILSCDDCCHQEDLQHPCFSHSHPSVSGQWRLPFASLFTFQSIDLIWPISMDIIWSWRAISAADGLIWLDLNPAV